MQSPVSTSLLVHWSCRGVSNVVILYSLQPHQFSSNSSTPITPPSPPPSPLLIWLTHVNCTLCSNCTLCYRSALNFYNVLLPPAFSLLQNSKKNLRYIKLYFSSLNSWYLLDPLDYYALYTHNTVSGYSFICYGTELRL